MKRVFAMLLTALMVIATMSGCGSTTKPASSTTPPAAEATNAVEAPEKDPYEDMEPITISVASSSAEGGLFMTMLAESCGKITERTNGKIQFVMYPGNQLGSVSDCMEQMMNGATIMTGVGMANLSTYVKEAAIPGYPYVCNSKEDMLALINSEWWASIKEQLLEDCNIVPVLVSSNGFRNMIGTVPVRSAEDLSTVITRIGLGTIGQEFVAATGGTPTVTSSFSDCYSAIQTGMFELCEADLETLWNAGLAEVADYLSITHHMMNPACMFVNGDVWNSIPAEYQVIILEEYDNFFSNYFDEATSQESDWIAKFEEAGVTIIPNSEMDVQSFRDTIPYILEAEGIEPAVYDQVIAAIG